MRPSHPVLLYCNACLDRPAGPVWSFRVCTCMMMDSRVVSDAYDQRKPQSHNSYASSLDDVNACVYIYFVRYRHSPEPDVTNYVSTSKIGLCLAPNRSFFLMLPLLFTDATTLNDLLFSDEYPKCTWKYQFIVQQLDACIKQTSNTHQTIWLRQEK